ncbi:hypothetical protein HMPREF1549_02060 [Actinomyces johnsonii F0510]|uniref:Uncharacterized protein n=1 Tax=Actinomyces johnsonii F0510 TaxID=1227262 RepID=U1REJ6_9ACTO|nr:hypothetical protein HMPREF1549_02060 [Actinomyces johnsonii F0510]
MKAGNRHSGGCAVEAECRSCCPDRLSSPIPGCQASCPLRCRCRLPAH